MFIFLLTLRWEWKNADCSKNGWCDFPNAITNSENSQTSPKPKHAWLPNSVTMVNNCWESALQSRATRFQVDFLTKIIWLGWWYLWLGCNNIFLRFRINLRINKVNCKALKITKRQRDQGIFPNKWKQKKNLVYLGVKTYEVFLCFVAIVRVRVYYVDFFVFFVYITGECSRFLLRGWAEKFNPVNATFLNHSQEYLSIQQSLWIIVILRIKTKSMRNTLSFRAL